MQMPFHAGLISQAMSAMVNTLQHPQAIKMAFTDILGQDMQAKVPLVVY